MRTEPLMPDLDALIRERLADPKSFLENGIEPLIDAIAETLDRHSPRTVNLHNDHGRWAPDAGTRTVCSECDIVVCDKSCPAALWPCGTVYGIAKALGIEIPNGQ